jgi:hypothetical protein
MTSCANGRKRSFLVLRELPSAAMKMSRRRLHPNSGGGNQAGPMKLVVGVGHLNRRHRLLADVEPAELLPLLKQIGKGTGEEFTPNYGNERRALLRDYT